MNRTEMEEALGNCEFFKWLENHEISKIADLCRMQSHAQGEYVFQQGDLGEHLYVIAKGQVFLERTVDLGTRTGKVVIETLGTGRVLGCWSTLLDKPHILMSSAVCQTSTEIISFNGSDLRQIMVGNAEFGFNILERLCLLLRNRIQAAYGAMERI